MRKIVRQERWPYDKTVVISTLTTIVSPPPRAIWALGVSLPPPALGATTGTPMGNDRDTRYHRFIIRASPRTDVCLADDKGFLVQKDRGTLDTSLLPRIGGAPVRLDRTALARTLCRAATEAQHVVRISGRITGDRTWRARGLKEAIASSCASSATAGALARASKRAPPAVERNGVLRVPSNAEK